jgi:hypothetical protein
MSTELARKSRPSWDGPTGELPLYSKGAAAIPEQPALVAYTRPVQDVARTRTWRPDLWPAAIWVPLLLSMPVLGLGLVVATIALLAS